MSNRLIDINSVSPHVLKNMAYAARVVESHLNGGRTILREKQIEITRSIVDKWDQGIRSMYLDLPTGSGKTVILSQVIDAIYKEGRQPKVLIVTDSRNLVRQTKNEFSKYAPNVPIGMYFTDQKEDKPVTITTFASFPRFARNNPLDYDFVIFDEAHKALSKKRLEYSQEFKDATFLALSATPAYSRDKNLEQYFDLAYRMSVPQAIDESLICGFRNVLVRSDYADFDHVKLLSTGNFEEESLARAVNVYSRNKSAAEFYRYEVDPYTGLPILGRRGIINTVNVDHALAVEKVFQDTIPSNIINGKTVCVAIYGDMSSKLQQEILDAHKNEEILLLSNARLLSHGHDDIGIDLCLNLAPSRSLVDVQQRAGRAMRFNEYNIYKTALIIDFMDKVQADTKKGLIYGDVVGQGMYVLPAIKRRDSLDLFNRDKDLPKNPSNIYTASIEHLKDLEVFWDSKEVDSIINSNRSHLEAKPYYGRKQNDELSPYDIAKRLKVKSANVVKILNRLELTVEDGQEKWIDPLSDNSKEDSHFKAVLRSWSTGDVICLKEVELEKFRSIYFSNERKYTDEISVSDLSKKIRVQFTKVQETINSLEPLKGHEDAWIHPDDRNKENPEIYHLAVRRSNKGDRRFLKEVDLEKFNDRFFPYELKYEDEISAFGISKSLNVSSEAVSKIINRFEPINEEKTLWIDPEAQKTDESIVFNMALRRARKGEFRYLKEDNIEKLRINYFASSRKNANEISISGLTKWLKTKYQTVLEIVDRLKPLEGQEDLWFDPEMLVEGQAPDLFHLKVRRSPAGDRKFIEEQDVERFRQVYFSLDQKQDDELSSTAIAKRLRTNTGSITEIVNRFIPFENEENSWIDPLEKNKEDHTIFHFMIRRTNNGPVKYLKEKEFDKFRQTYFAVDIKQKDELSPSDIVKRLVVSNKKVITILDRLQPVDESKELWFDPDIPASRDKPVGMAIRKGVKTDMRCLKENSLDTFANRYDYKYRLNEPVLN